MLKIITYNQFQKRTIIVTRPPDKNPNIERIKPTIRLFKNISKKLKPVSITFISSYEISYLLFSILVSLI